MSFTSGYEDPHFFFLSILLLVFLFKALENKK